MKIENSRGYTEAILDENCSIDNFHKTADVIHTILDISFTNKMSDLESTYWDFIYEGREFTLHYNIFLGISIYPKLLENAIDADNRIVLYIYTTLLNNLH